MTYARRKHVRVLHVALIGLAILGGCGDRPKLTPRSTTTASAEGGFTELAPDIHEPCGMTGAAGALWVLGCSGTLVRVADEGGARISRKLDDDTSGLDGLAGDGADSVWALLAIGKDAEAREGGLVQLDAASGRTLATIDLGRSIPVDAVHAAGTLWVGASDGTLFSVADGEARRIAGGAPLMWVLADASRIWTVAEDGDVIERDAAGREVRTFDGVMPGPIAASVGLNALWVASAERGVVRLDPKTGDTSDVAVTGTVNDIEACGGRMWLSQPDFGVRSVDAAGGIVRSVALAVGARYLLCDGGDRLWIVSEDGRLGSIDPTD